jgi:hypothetical protein
LQSKYPISGNISLPCWSLWWVSINLIASHIVQLCIQFSLCFRFLTNFIVLEKRKIMPLWGRKKFIWIFF